METQEGALRWQTDCAPVGQSGNNGSGNKRSELEFTTVQHSPENQRTPSGWWCVPSIRVRHIGGQPRR